MGADTAQAAGGFRQSLRFRLLLLAILPMLAVVGLFATYFAQHSIAAAERQLRQGAGTWPGTWPRRWPSICSPAICVCETAAGFRTQRAPGRCRRHRRSMAIGYSPAARPWLLPAWTSLPGTVSQDGRNQYFTHPVGLPAPPHKTPICNWIATPTTAPSWSSC